MEKGPGMDGRHPGSEFCRRWVVCALSMMPPQLHQFLAGLVAIAFWVKVLHAIQLAGDEGPRAELGWGWGSNCAEWHQCSISKNSLSYLGNETFYCSSDSLSHWPYSMSSAVRATMLAWPAKVVGASGTLVSMVASVLGDRVTNATLVGEVFAHCPGLSGLSELQCVALWLGHLGCHVVGPMELIP